MKADCQGTAHVNYQDTANANFQDAAKVTVRLLRNTQPDVWGYSVIMAEELFDAASPEAIAAAAEARVLGTGSGTVGVSETGGVDGGLADLDDVTIGPIVGPGALSQPLDVVSAREAAKQFSNAPAPVTGEEANVLRRVTNLDAQESSLRAVAQEFGVTEGGAIGNYYGDLATGEVMAGPQIPEDRRIGPFHSAALARAAVAEARNKYTHPF